MVKKKGGLSSLLKTYSALLKPNKVNGQWLNSMGQTVAIKWGKGQPDNYSINKNGAPENCLQFWGGDLGKMNDQVCINRKRPVVCETKYL